MFASSNHLSKSSTTSRPELVTSLILPCMITTCWPKIGHVRLYAGGSQHTRRSTFPARTSQIQPSSRNLSNVSGQGGIVSSAAHGGRCWEGIRKIPLSVMMRLWLSKKEKNEVRCEVLHLKRRWTC